MRITKALIDQSPQFLNPVRQRELNLRGYKIPVIENLGATLDNFDVIDLSDNAILKLDNLPLLKRLTALLLNNNRIQKVGSHLGSFLPNIETLILTNNNFTQLKELDPLASFTKLKRISLLHTPVSRQRGYRLYVIHKIPSLRHLDFQKIKQKEREESTRVFGEPVKYKPPTPQERAAAAGAESSESKDVAKTFVPGQQIVNKLLTPEQRKDLVAAIKGAKTLEEMDRLENILKSGHLPESGLPTSSDTMDTS